MSPTKQEARPLRPATVALAGLVALGVAMGIGRFAFTPLLPMMLHEGLVTLPGASALASANYLGYLLGALLCMLQPWLWARYPRLPRLDSVALLRGGLLATCLLTLAMALPVAALWPALRLLAGVASAVVFVFTSGWCLARLTQLGVPALGGAIYAGPGLGIALSGLAVSGMTALQGSAALAWGLFGALAALLSALVWPVFGTAVPVAAAAAAAPATSAPAHQGRFGREKAVFVLAYGLAGFGYIITATFLPVIARTALPASPWLDLFWPIFGVGVVIGALSATRLPMALDRRHLLAAGYLMQALGVAASIWSPSVAGFVLGSLLVGLPFTAITFFAMQEARRLQPTATASLMGLLTAAYGLGQIAGPPLATALLAHSATRDFTPSLQVAAAALVLGALTFAWLARRHPVRV